jgi:hypothetical protein
MTRRPTASVVCSIWLAALALAAPALGDSGGGDNSANASSELQREYPLHEPRQCCSASPTPAAGAVEPAASAGADGDDDGANGLPAAALVLVALFAALALWLVARLIRRPAGGTGAAATATAGHAAAATDRSVELPTPPRRPPPMASPAVAPDDTSTATDAVVGLREQTEGEPPPAEPNDFVTEVLNAALEHLRDGSWVWADGAEEAVADVAASLSESTEEHEMVLDAIALGYWIRYVERDFTQVNIADPDFVADLRSRYRSRGAAEISAAMALVAADMPGAFLRGPTLWAVLQGEAGSILEQRASRLMARHDRFADDAAISPEIRELALALGYGLCVTVESLGIGGVRERAG